MTSHARCSRALRAQGKPSPRTCQECGLGPCKDTPGIESRPPVETGSLWVHRNTGNHYTVLTVTNRHALKPEYPVTVVYRDEHGIDWSRPFAGWHEAMILDQAPL